MQPPDELMVQQFLPAIRLLVARSLRGQGYSQTKISSMLGITQASVSLYGSSSAQKAYLTLASLSVGREDADRYAALLSEDLKRNPVYAVETLITLWTTLLGKGAICEAHRRAYPSLAQCDFCIREFGRTKGERSDAIALVTEAVKMIEGSPTFVSVMPEVSVNIAFLAGDSESPEDVVAVPGRIVRVKDSARAMQRPAPGASKHMAGVLLLVRKRRRDVRAAVNLRYDARIAATLKTLGLRTLAIGGYPPSKGEDPTLGALTSRLLASKGDFDAIVDTGSRGIEPNLYLFGSDPREVAKLAIEISEKYSPR